MSSIYNLICMNHDPAILLDAEYNSVGDAMIAAGKPETDSIRAHARCDLVIACYSGGLVELGCPAMLGKLATWDHAHEQTIWISAEWLRLLAVAKSSLTGTPIADAAKQLDRGCWSFERIDRMWNVLYPRGV